jgi:hypothetical protein
MHESVTTRALFSLFRLLILCFVLQRMTQSIDEELELMCTQEKCSAFDSRMNRSEYPERSHVIDF